MYGALLYSAHRICIETDVLATPLWYNAALVLLKPLYRWRIRKRAQSDAAYQQECCERFGPFQPPQHRHAIWFHAVSVGETNAAQPLIEHYLQAGHPVLVTNTTKTGQARAKTLFLKPPYQDRFQAVYLPVDQVHLLREFFARYQPKILILVETELWPNLIDQAAQHGVARVLINARLSEKSARGYARVAGLTRGMLNNLSALLAQDQNTQQRYISLGLAANKSQVVGNIKFDIHAPEAVGLQAASLVQQWQLGTRKIMVLASTHAPEEQQLLTALKTHLNHDPALLCIVVPRHPERFDEVFRVSQDLGLNTSRRSLAEPIMPETQVYLADSMGELWLWYALAQVAFVGGSLNTPGGGHNILEPMALDCPVVIGPRYFNFQTIVDEFVEAAAIDVAPDALQAVEYLLSYANASAQAAARAQHAQTILARNQGALDRHIALLDGYIT